MVIQKDIKEDTEEHLGMHSRLKWMAHEGNIYEDIVGEHILKT